MAMPKQGDKDHAEAGRQRPCLSRETKAMSKQGDKAIPMQENRLNPTSHSKGFPNGAAPTSRAVKHHTAQSRTNFLRESITPVRCSNCKDGFRPRK